jgi:hypothetical protein
MESAVTHRTRGKEDKRKFRRSIKDSTGLLLQRVLKDHLNRDKHQHGEVQSLLLALFEIAESSTLLCKKLAAKKWAFMTDLWKTLSFATYHSWYAPTGTSSSSSSTTSRPR